MSRSPLKTLLIFIGLIVMFQAEAQIFSHEYDSIPISKPKFFKQLYVFGNSESKEIVLKEKAKRTGKMPGQIWRNAGGYGLTLLLGGSLGSSSYVTWEIPAKLVCDNEDFNWEISLFCPGELNKDRERIKNDDGSYSVVKTETGSLFWEDGAMGLIIEKEDTICSFAIVMEPRLDSILMQWTHQVLDQPKYSKAPASATKKIFEPVNFISPEFGLVGFFRNNNFAFIFNGNTNQSWIFLNDELVSMSKSVFDDSWKKNQNKSPLYVLLSHAIPESQQLDYYRLSVLAVFLNNQISQRTFEN